MLRNGAACRPISELVGPKVLCNSIKPLWHNLAMAKPPVIEDKQIEHLIKATAAYSRVPLRDTALLLTLYGTALAVTELATITVGDYLLPNGAVPSKVQSGLMWLTTALSGPCTGQTSEWWRR